MFLLLVGSNQNLATLPQFHTPYFAMLDDSRDGGMRTNIMLVLPARVRRVDSVVNLIKQLILSPRCWWCDEQTGILARDCDGAWSFMCVNCFQVALGEPNNINDCHRWASMNRIQSLIYWEGPSISAGSTDDEVLAR